MSKLTVDTVGEVVLVQKSLPDIVSCQTFTRFKTVDKGDSRVYPHVLDAEQPRPKSGGLQSVVNNVEGLQRADYKRQ